MKHLILVLVSGVLLLTACRPIKSIQTVVNKQLDTTATVAISDPRIDSAAVKTDILAKVARSQIGFTTFFAEVKVDFTDVNGKNTKATAFLRMKKDSIIWLSFTGMLGIEGYRILVRPDTVLIMDKLQKNIAYRSVSFLQDFIKLPLDFYTLQNLLLGNTVFFANNIISYRNIGNDLLALSIGEYFKHLITIDTASGHISNSKLDDVQELRNRTCNISLTDYAMVQGRSFSQSRDISVAEKAKLDVKLDFRKVEFDTPQTFPFNVPKSYNRK